MAVLASAARFYPAVERELARRTHSGRRATLEERAAQIVVTRYWLPALKATTPPVKR
jgi:hypothetical protein